MTTTTMTNDIIIAEAVRSAVGRGHKGALATKRPDELAADVLRGLMARVPQAKGHVEDIVAVRAVAYDNGHRVYRDFVVDELPRPETTLDGLAKLPPAFAQGGSVTVGNSSPISDGAAAALVVSAKKAKQLGLKGLGWFRAFVTVGVDPAIMGIGPLPAVQKLLARTG